MKELIIFDVDDTIINGQSQKLFLSYLYEKGYISTFFYIRLISWFILYKMGLIKDPRPAMEYAFSFARGKSEVQISTITNDFFESVLKNKIYKESIKIIEEHKKNNRRVILVSNAVGVLIEPLSKYLEISDYISTKLEIVDGLYTGRISGDIIYGKLKDEAIQNYVKVNRISLNNSWEYTDHHSDISSLSLVTHPYAVNPTGELKKFAIIKKWPIIYFKS